jgi:RNA polymerase sigma factor (TIGR02999 family)
VSTEEKKPITRALEAAAQGDPRAARELLPLVYHELRALARARLSRLPPGQTLQPTALVHEAYLRLAGTSRGDSGWSGRGPFFAAAARAMRDILVEEARRKASLKRGGDFERIDLERAAPAFLPPSADILAVDEAVTRLETIDPRKAAIVNLRYFARLTVDETALAVGVCPATIRRECRFIRAWLEREIRDR